MKLNSEQWKNIGLPAWWISPACLLALLVTLGLVPMQQAQARGAVCLIGGGGEDYGAWSDQPYGWFVQQAGNGTIAVLSTDRSATEWIPTYLESLGARESYNVVAVDAAAANSDAVVNAILAADGIFIKGGDQWDYVSQWVNTRLSQALLSRFNAGAAIAGTSAGAMILGQVIFDASKGGADPWDALANPYATDLTFSYGFLNLLPGTIVDTHFTARGRIGRLGAFMARASTDFNLKVSGIGVDEDTALAISPDGVTAEVMGAGAVTLMHWTPSSELNITRGAPLQLKNLAADILTPGYRTDLSTRTVTARPPGAVLVSSPVRPAPAGVTSVWSDEIGTPPYASDIRPWAKAVGTFKTVAVVAPTTAEAQYLVQPLREAFLRPKLVGWKSASGASTIDGAAGVVLLLSRTSDDLTDVRPGTPIGDALARAVKAGKPLAMAVEGNTLAGQNLISNLMDDPYGLVEGTLSFAPGLNLVPGVAVMPLAWASSDYAENRNGGLVGLVARQKGGLGILQDLDCSVQVQSGSWSVQGDEATVFLDARTLKSYALTSVVMLDADRPRQSAALEAILVHYLAPGYALQ